MRIKTILLSIFLFALNSTITFAQKDKADTNKYNESVIVLGGYEPTLSDAFKINTNPTLFDTVPRIMKFQYDAVSKKYPTSFIPDAIRPAKITGEPITRLYKNYLKLGLGTYLSPLAEFYFNSTRSRNVLYGGYVNHFSSWWNLKDYGTSTFSNTNVNAFGKYFWEKSVFSGEVFYANDFYHYYGFKEKDVPALLGNEEEIDSKTYSQVYNNIGLRASYKSLYTTDDKLHHLIGFELSNLSNKYETNELNVKGYADINKKFELFNQQKQTLGLSVLFDMDNDKTDLTKHPITSSGYDIRPAFEATKENSTQSLLKIYPYFLFSLYNFNFDVGLNFNFAIENETKVYLHPYGKASQSFLNNQLNVYAGISSDLKKNSFQTLRVINPYIRTNTIDFQLTDNKINFFAGAKSNPMKQLDVQFELMYSSLNNTPIFVIDPTFVLQNVYKVVYDDVDLYKFKGQLSYSFEKDLNLGLGINYYIANTDNEDKYWYNPSFDMNISAKYTIDSKIAVGVTTKFIGPMPGYYYNELGAKQEETLKGRIDLNLSLEYNYNKSLTFFWLLNNIANQRYYEWSHYPTQRINTMIGLTYSFR